MIDASAPPARAARPRPGLVAAGHRRPVAHTWHVLDNRAEPTRGHAGVRPRQPDLVVPVAAVPRRRAARLAGRRRRPAGHGVLRADARRGRWRERVDDLDAVLDALDVHGPVVVGGHDWGGPISLGWALPHRDQLRGVVLANTAVHQPAGAAGARADPAGPHARAAATRCARRTPLFVRATTALSRPALPAGRAGRVRGAVPDRRRGAGRSRSSSPTSRSSPRIPARRRWTGSPRASASWTTCRRCCCGARATRCSPTATCATCGPGCRTPTCTATSGRRTWSWRTRRRRRATPGRGSDTSRSMASDMRPTDRPSRPHHGSGVPDAVGGAGGASRRPFPRRRRAAVGRTVVVADLLARRVRELAAGLAAHGVAPGDRVALLVPPGADLTAAVYACWRAGASVVVADPGLGAAGLARALRGAHPAHVVGAPPRPRARGRAGRARARRIAAGPPPATAIVAGRARRARPARPGSARRAAATLPARGRDRTPRPPCCSPPAPRARPRASSTGTGRPRAQLAALRDGVRDHRGRPARRGLPAVRALRAGARHRVGRARRRCKPGALTAAALADAVAAVDATMVFASPAALRNVVATAAELGRGQRDALARRPAGRLRRRAGARRAAARAARPCCRTPTAHTPYGMTEALPVTDIALRRDRRGRPGQRGVRRAAAARRRRRRSARCRPTAGRTARSPASPA